jgi:hypothetical protein
MLVYRFRGRAHETPESEVPALGSGKSTLAQSQSAKASIGSCGEEILDGETAKAETKRCVSTTTATTHRRRPDAAGFLLERGDDLLKEHDLLATDCEVSRQAAVPESAERVVCRRGAGKQPKAGDR